MKLKPINVTKRTSDVIFNVVANHCEFFRDQNGEIYTIYLSNDGYTIKYLSATSDVKNLFRKLYYFQGGLL